jgi:hypothetical protein
MDEELAVPFRSEDRRRDHGAGPQAESPGLVDDLLENRAVDGRVADDAMIGAALADLELGLHESDDRATGRPGAVPEGRGDRTQHESQRDEGNVDHSEVDRLAQGLRRQVPGVQPIVDDDPRIAGDPVGELAAPDIDRVDPGRAALQQDIAEAAGRGASVEADPAGRIDPERIEGRGELATAPTDIRIPLDERDREPTVDQVARLAIGPRGVALPGPDPAGEDQRLGSGARLGQATLDEELVQALAGRSVGRRATHPGIVAQRPSPRLNVGGLDHDDLDGTRAMTSRPFSLVFATVLLILIGVSGVGAGAELLAVASGEPTGALIGGGIAGYGLACVAAGIGLFQLRRWGWLLAAGSIVVGLAILLWIQIVLIGAAPDSVSAVGLVVWGLTLVLLLTPATRRALRS